MKLLTPLCILILITFGSCTSAKIKRPVQLSFALTANTAPESAFRVSQPNLPKLIDAINKENPVFLIHTGNFVQGGDSRTGLRRSDYTTQFNSVSANFAALRSISYIAPAEQDCFDGTFDLFRELTARNEYFSFNYGGVHICIINGTGNNSEIPLEQRLWMENDLSANKEAYTIVISRIPLFVPENQKGITPLSDSSLLVDLLKDNGIKAVISTAGKDTFKIEKDGISFINLPIDDINARYHRDPSFYIIEIREGLIKYTPYRIN